MTGVYITQLAGERLGEGTMHELLLVARTVIQTSLVNGLTPNLQRPQERTAKLLDSFIDSVDVHRAFDYETMDQVVRRTETSMGRSSCFVTPGSRMAHQN
ncbi:hypothetical protein EOA33_00220 [Mesorhizobium sp. M4A.F.Ca.ET.050.02.1.1]|uniref:hypothetical protein n=1 Tax=Mesorhizobium sp. M4A.F.Ca.ET.050.02.1.1 TaxID=2496754 RepID=UPI000FCCD040|nr:hypothetical protein [Mesorhizobium sp. M4A.F.Ca.ET.050.02.1.1]RUX53133.1 hypothetical protein EOA33_00220 [Mesorhizobium sp. M4A.F.Ca.ET.050.02.1.1]TGP46975.1 hypothetical protein EN873_37115 [bacterium M00.F.Ca.ET.230.01.1.1]TIW29455.1 MAG: hypothetical protein E5V63_01000 [Mesorhizobium sp.]